MGCVEGQRKNRPIMEQLTYHLFCLVAKLGQKFEHQMDFVAQNSLTQKVGTINWKCGHIYK